MGRERRNASPVIRRARKRAPDVLGSARDCGPNPSSARQVRQLPSVRPSPLALAGRRLSAAAAGFHRVIAIDCAQGSREWYQARLGIPTASGFSKLLTRAGKPSTQADRYMRDLLAEHFIGEPVGIDASGFMQRGTALEDQARKWYEWERDCTVKRVGFCLRDDRMAGASPDGLVGDAGLLELKCPSATTHIAYLLGDLEGEYWPQCQGQLYITDREWVDLVAFSSVLPSLVVRI